MDNKETIKKLVGLLARYRKTIVVIIGCLLISTGLNLCIPLISKRLMDDGFIGGNQSLLIQLVLLTMAIYGINSVIEILKEKKRVEIAAKIQYTLSEQSFAHLLKLKISYFNNTNYAEILNNINMDVGRMSSIADNNVFFVITQVFSTVGGIIGLFIIDYRMTILVLVFIPIKFFVTKYFAREQKKIVDEYIISSQNYAKWFGDTVGGVKEVRLFHIFDNKHKEFEHRQSNLIEKQKKMNMLMQWNMITDTIVVQILSTLLYIIGANLVFDLQLSVGSVFAFITYSTYVTGPISAILNIGYFMSGIIPSTKRYYDFMELHEETDKGTKLSMEDGDLSFEKVSFSYDANRQVFSDINLVLKKGSKTALVGRNGSGKTTMIQLLTRLYEPTGGRICIGGTDISAYSLEAYRDMVSVVSQQIYLFNDTIRNNICLYKQVSDEAVLSACLDSDLGEFIQEVSLEYMVGENGAMLSGGQKQKIALARALIHDKPIIIFDEATSNTDAYSEKQINGLLHTRLKDKTVIAIAHKKELLQEVDQIITLQEGGIICQTKYQPG